MTALSADLARASMPDLTARALSIGVAASTTIYQGSLVATQIGGSGYAVVASADRSLRVLGVAVKRAVNTTAEGYGSAGQINVEVARGVWAFANSSSTDAITAADVGEPCYVVDDNTVARTSSAGSRPVAGTVVRIENSKVFVEIGAAQVQENGAIDLMFAAAADYSTTGQYRFVDLNGSSKAALVTSAGAKAIGVLQNAPVADAIAIVRVQGVSQVYASDTIADGTLLAVEATNGRAKAAVAGTVAGGAGDPTNDALVGSHVMGVALSDGTVGALMRMLVRYGGAIPTTAA